MTAQERGPKVVCEVKCPVLGREMFGSEIEIGLDINKKIAQSHFLC